MGEFGGSCKVREGNGEAIVRMRGKFQVPKSFSARIENEEVWRWILGHDDETSSLITLKLYKLYGPKFTSMSNYSPLNQPKGSRRKRGQSALCFVLGSSQRSSDSERQDMAENGTVPGHAAAGGVGIKHRKERSEEEGRGKTTQEDGVVGGKDR